ncbi:hypothetical protein ACH4OW_14795 [Streptomyces sp. NPDC017056]|uniref:hypothetical protein n=1 Tax=Streptomyces sp. NPDC017056 TaxID=3364973 RepID=UPI0037998EF1
MSSSRIPASLADLAVPVDQLAVCPRNPRTGDLDAITKSLSANGQYRPIVVNKGSLNGRPNADLADSHTLKAAKRLSTALLADILSDLPDLQGTGYDQAQLDQLLDDTALPAPIELPTDGTGPGTAATVDYLQWSYLQWSSTRMRITQAEVEVLDALYRQLVDAHDSDSGFGWHVLNEEHQTREGDVP